SRALLASALLLWALLGPGAGCASDLSTSRDGFECDANGRCGDGYACDTETNSCVNAGSLDEDDDPTPRCEQGETVCDGRCVNTERDPENCDRCGATCTAPPGGTPACVTGECDFVCGELTR